MNLVNLQTFLKIVETGNLVRASVALNVTQSTVTARLKQLEEELGQSLLHRHKTGVALTNPGHKLKTYAEVMMGLWRQIRLDVSLPKEIDGICNLGCEHDLWGSLGREVRGQIIDLQMLTLLSIIPGDAVALDKMLTTRMIEAAITYTPMASSGRTVRTVAKENLVLFSNRPETSARADPLYICVDLGEKFRAAHTAAYSDAGVAKTSYGSPGWAIDHILRYGGSAYLPEQLAEPYLQRGELFKVPDTPIFEREIYFVMLSDESKVWQRISPLIDALQATVQDAK